MSDEGRDRPLSRRERKALGNRLAKDLDPKTQLTVALSHSRSESFTSQLPSAKELREIDAVVPGGAERMLVLLEKQSEHRQFIEKVAIRGDTGRANMGLAAGFVVAMFGLWVGWDLVRSGHQLAGAVVGTVDLVSLVTVFIYGSATRRGERTDKTKIRANAIEARKNR